MWAINPLGDWLWWLSGSLLLDCSGVLVKRLSGESPKYSLSFVLSEFQQDWPLFLWDLPLVPYKVVASHVVSYNHNCAFVILYELYSLITTALNIMAKKRVRIPSCICNCSATIRESLCFPRCLLCNCMQITVNNIVGLVQWCSTKVARHFSANIETTVLGNHIKHIAIVADVILSKVLTNTTKTQPMFMLWPLLRMHHQEPWAGEIV